MFVLLLTVFVDLVGFGLVFPILPFYAQAYDASVFEITVLVAVYSGMQIVAAPLWGRLSDRFGRKRILITTLAGGAAAYLWFGFADSLMALFLARGLNGAMAGNVAVAKAYMADLTGPRERAQAMGRIGAAFGLGFMIGPALGGLLYDPAGAGGGFALLMCLGTSFCHPTLTAMVSQRAAAEHQGIAMGITGAVASTGRILSPPVAGVLFQSLGATAPLLAAGVLLWPVVVAAAVMSLQPTRQESEELR